MAELAVWVDRIKPKRVLIVGDLMLDRYIWGEAERISPEAPVLVLREDQDEVRPGGAANVASFLRHMRAEVVLAGVLGNDSEGRILHRLLVDGSIDVGCVLTADGRLTTTKQRFVGRCSQRQPHQILRVDRESRAPLAEQIESQLIELILRVLRSCDAILISDYAKGVCTPRLLQMVVEQAREQQVPVLVDPCRGGDYSRYAGATLVAPNRIAAALESGQSALDMTSAVIAADQLRQRLNLEIAVITLDRDGMAYATAEESGTIPCRPRDVCDVTGAGDMVLATLGMSRANQFPWRESLQLANTAAGLEVERFGVEPVSWADIRRDLASENSVEHKLVSHDELARRVRHWRMSKRAVVFTNGCFDLMHVGHVSLLEAAARQGEVLIVAINSDRSIRQLKGQDRPVIPEQHRARLLAALNCVDAVIVFDDDTPIPLLRELQPDVLVKGAEYSRSQVVGADVVASYGGRIVTVPMIPGLSTTQILREMQQRTALRSTADERLQFSSANEIISER